MPVRLFAGDDRGEDHHDIEVMDEARKVLAKRRLPEGVAGMTQLHELIGRFLPENEQDAEVVTGIETDRGPWAAALIAAGYTVCQVNPLQASRYRERHGVSGAKSDGGDAHMLAEMVRTDSRQLRAAAGDSPEAEGIKVVARMYKMPIWERTRAVQRLRCQLREYFPAALAAFEHLARPAALTAAYAATVRALIAVITAPSQQIQALQGQVEERFGQHTDAEVYYSQPGLAVIPGARVPGEFGDDPHRYVSAKARKNYGGTSPITRASGK